MRTLVLFATITATADAIVNLIIPKNGRIKSLRWSGSFDGPADNARCNMELSMRATSQFATNDISNVVGGLDLLQNILTSGGGVSPIKYQEYVDFPVAAGERLYLHASVSGTVSCPLRMFIDIMD